MQIIIIVEISSFHILYEITVTNFLNTGIIFSPKVSILWTSSLK